MKSLSALLLAALSTLNLQLSTPSRAQGSLTPTGPPGPVMKTLDQVEARTPVNAVTAPGDATYLFKITQPGSYYLTGNITGVAGKRGILIAAAGVRLDLNGFTLTGPAPGDDENGIHVTGEGVSVSNGTLSGWREYGIVAVANGACFTRLTCTGCGRLAGLGGGVPTGGGLSASAGGTVVDCVFLKNVSNGCNAGPGGVSLTRCTARGNGRFGIYTGSGAIVDHCTASGNTSGYWVGAGSVATGCSASENNDIGFVTYGSLVDCTAFGNKGHGITTAGEAKIQGCSASINGSSGTGSGMVLSDQTAAENCSADSNATDGIAAENHCSVKHCTAHHNISDGISAGTYATIENCAANDNFGDGIAVGTHGSVRHCTAHINGSDGITAGIYATIANCAANGNAADGIAAAGGSLVRECTAMKNGAAGAAAGIHLTGSGSRIESNSTRDNTGTGILATSGDIIIRNASGVNSVANYSPSSGNGFAPVQSPATQTNPNANF